MSDITFPSWVNNEATKKRTQEFFDGLAQDILDKELATDEKLTSLVEQGICVDATDNNLQTPLILAAANGKISTVQALIKAHADIERGDDNFCSPLFWAVNNGHISVVKALLAAGASVKKRGNFDKQSPLTAAIFKGNIASMRTLLAAGADIMESRNYNVTQHRPLMEAAHRKDAKLTKILLASGVES
jgi:ankyrin repeat protein